MTSDLYIRHVHQICTLGHVAPEPSQALFDAKGMAGNIIHAIATTNAIISGLIVVEALKILAGVNTAPRRDEKQV